VAVLPGLLDSEDKGIMIFQMSGTNYSRITSAKSPSFCMTTFSTNLTNLTVLLPPSLLQLLHKQMNTVASTTVIAETHWSMHTLLTCDIWLGSLTLSVPEAGDFVELLLLHPTTQHTIPEDRYHHVIYFYHTAWLTCQLWDESTPHCKLLPLRI
jgi:hypothetical protein